MDGSPTSTMAVRGTRMMKKLRSMVMMKTRSTMVSTVVRTVRSTVVRTVRSTVVSTVMMMIRTESIRRTMVMMTMIRNITRAARMMKKSKPIPLTLWRMKLRLKLLKSMVE
jgi:hypothetical protein